MAKFNFNKSVNPEGEKSLSEKADVIENKKKFDIRYISHEDIVPNPENFYELTDIDGLAESINELGLIQNLEVKELEEEGSKKYKLLTGHRRFEAIKKLIDEGAWEGKIPCKVVKGIDEVEEMIRLIKSNSDTRELTAKEKRLQVEKLTELNQLRKDKGEKLNVKKEVAETMGTDRKTVERYNNINNKLIAPLQEYFDNNEITFTEAYNFATLDEQMQLAILDLLQENNKVSKEELNTIRLQNKKLVEEKEEISKELEEKKEEVSNLESEKIQLENELEANKVEQEVIEEERAKLEKKIKEDISKLTEEEINRIKQELEDYKSKAKTLEEKSNELAKKLETKEAEHKEALENIEAEKSEVQSSPINKEELEREVAKSKIKDKLNLSTKEIINAIDLAKKNNLLDEAQYVVNELEKILAVCKNKAEKIK
ncbi:MAG: ParB N-terminal domain-containing protein [Clostridium paraputrificum]